MCELSRAAVKMSVSYGKVPYIFFTTAAAEKNMHIIKLKNNNPPPPKKMYPKTWVKESGLFLGIIRAEFDLSCDTGCIVKAYYSSVCLQRCTAVTQK